MTPPVVVPEQPVVVAGGSLSWAVSRAFTSYVIGDIAHGAVAVSGGATSSGSLNWGFKESFRSYIEALVADPDCGVMTTQGEEAETAVTPISAEVEADAGTPVWPWIVGIIVLIAAAIIVTIVVIRRRTTPTDQA